MHLKIVLSVCSQTPHVEEQKPLIFSIVDRFILILKDLNVKHETFSSLFSSFDQDENLTNLNSGQADDYLYLIWNHNQSLSEDNIDLIFLSISRYSWTRHLDFPRMQKKLVCTTHHMFSSVMEDLWHITVQVGGLKGQNLC